MSYEKLQEYILEEARSQAHTLGRDLEAKRLQEEMRIRNKARQIEETILQHAEIRGQETARKTHQEAELAGKAAVLAAKQEELNATQHELLQQLVALEEDTQKKLIQRLLKHIPKEKGEIIAGSRHKKLLTGLIQSTHTLSPHTIQDEGGFIFRSKTKEINMTLSHLVSGLFSRFRTDLAKELFS